MDATGERDLAAPGLQRALKLHRSRELRALFDAPCAELFYGSGSGLSRGFS
jgi:hypothetical protein